MNNMVCNIGRLAQAGCGAQPRRTDRQAAARTTKTFTPKKPHKISAMKYTLRFLARLSARNSKKHDARSASSEAELPLSPRPQGPDLPWEAADGNTANNEALPAEPQLYPDLSAIEASAKSQADSMFLSRLPVDIRLQIYGELWRGAGLSQHIFKRADCANDGQDRRTSRFTHWPCTTEFSLEDDRQEALAEALEAMGSIPNGILGGSFANHVWSHRMYSPWYNHWACRRNMRAAYGLGEERFDDRSQYQMPCPVGCQEHAAVRVSSLRGRDPFLPTLLTCKRM